MKTLSFVLLLLISPLLFPQEEQLTDIEKQYILLDGPRIDKADKKLLTELRKTVMSILLKDPTYTILLNKDVNLRKSKLQAFRIDIVGNFKKDKSRDKNQYDLQMTLFNEKNGKTVREIYEIRIAERHLFYRIRIMVYELLYGEDYLQKLDKKAREKEKKRKSKREKLPKPDFKSSLKKGGDPKEIEKSEEGEPKDKLAKEKKKKEEELAKKKTKKSKKKTKVSISNFSSPDLDLRKESRRSGPEKGPFKAYYDFSYGMGYTRETLNSKAKVKISTTTTEFEVENNLSLLQLMVRGNARLAPKDTMGLALQARLSRILGKTDFDVSAPMSLDFFIFKGFEALPIQFSFGFKYEAHSFANLGFASTGVQPWMNKIMWYTVGASLKIPVRNYWMSIGAEMGKVFSGSTNHQTKNTETPLGGSRLDIYLRSKLSGNLSLEFRKSTISVSSLGSANLDNSQDQTILSLIYN